MERYTMRLPDDLGAVAVSGYGTPEILDRLAAYEDTGLEPEKIKCLQARHGRWVWDKNGMDWNLGAWKCSECHCKPETWWETIKGSPYRCAGSHYCPTCGAKMDGGEDDAAG